MSRTVVVTGACGGIGSAVVELFAEKGWVTIGLDRSKPAGSTRLSDFVQCDIADAIELEGVVGQLSDHPRLDALVNNAAIPMDKPFSELDVEDWDLVMNTNVRASFILTQHLTAQLAQASGGVVNVASVHALATSRGVAAYAASKGALVAFTRAASLDLAELGVRVNAVCPGATDTAMLHAGLSGQRDGSTAEAGMAHLAAQTPLGRVGTPAEVANAVYFLADSSVSGFITGQALVIDGGATSRLSTE